MSRITLGADPEFFVASETMDGIFPEPIVGLLGGTKKKPIRLPMDGFFVQEDNVMAEYNIPPTSDAGTFQHHIVTGRRLVLDRLRERHPETDWTAHNLSSIEFSPEQLDSPQARTFGCSPDFDAYSQGAPLQPVRPELVGNWRFAGGHLHIGYKHFAPDIPEFVVAAFCDAFISLEIIRHGMDVQGERRRFYGTAGRYRQTEYGIEYRTLSNQWTLASHAAEHVAMLASQLGPLLADEKQCRVHYNELPWLDIRNAINREDRMLAMQLCNTISLKGD